jgi:nucleoside-diphosphate-sugar epimerase
MLIPRLIESVRVGQPITLAGGAGLYVTPLHVDDAVEFIDRLIDVESAHAVDTFNLAGTDIVELGSVVHEIENVLGIPAQIQVTDDPPVWLAGSNARLRRVTSFTPQVGIAAGIRNTVSAL